MRYRATSNGKRRQAWRTYQVRKIQNRVRRDVRPDSSLTPTSSVVAGNVCFREATKPISMADMRARIAAEARWLGERQLPRRCSPKSAGPLPTHLGRPPVPADLIMNVCVPGSDGYWEQSLREVAVDTGHIIALSQNSSAEVVAVLGVSRRQTVRIAQGFCSQSKVGTTSGCTVLSMATSWLW